MNNKINSFKALSYVPIYVFLIFWSIIQLFPVLWMFYSSLKTSNEISINAIALPTKLHFENFKVIWAKAENLLPQPLYMYFRNSLIVVLLSVAMILFSGILAAWGLSKYKFFGSKVILIVLILAIVFPIQSYMIPLYFQMTKFKLTNQWMGLAFVYAAVSLPFTVLILHSFFVKFPNELIEAARIDGASDTSILLKIAVPISKGIITTLAIINFIGLWNEFILSFLMLRKNSLQTINVAVYQFRMSHGRIDWNYIFSGLTFSYIVPLTLFLIFNRYITEGLTAGALKE